MVDRQNLVSFVERALLLKTLPVLSDANPDEIAAILSHVDERSFVPGTPIFRAGEAAAEIHVLVEGRARLTLPRGPVVRRAGELIGLLSALQQRPYPGACISETAVHTLTLRVDDLFDLLEDFFDLARSLVGYLARRVVERIDGAARMFDGAGPPPLVGDGPVDLIDKIVFMKGLPILAGATVTELADLGREVAEIAYATGDVVASKGQPADALYLVLRGRIAGRGARSSVGALAVLGQGTHDESLVAQEPSRVLRVPAEGFFDLLEDHFDMTLGIARSLCGAAVPLSPQ